MEIPNIELNEWIEVLEPYQGRIINKLLETHSEEETIDLWLSADGPNNTVKFGGEKKENQFTKNFKNEVYKLICGHDDYSKEYEELQQQGNIGKTMLVSSISAILAVNLGVAATILAPILVLIFFTIGKMGRNAYCETSAIIE